MEKEHTTKEKQHNRELQKGGRGRFSAPAPPFVVAAL